MLEFFSSESRSLLQVNNFINWSNFFSAIYNQISQQMTLKFVLLVVTRYHVQIGLTYLLSKTKNIIVIACSLSLKNIALFVDVKAIYN
jgi:hypothetical protein